MNWISIDDSYPVKNSLVILRFGPTKYAIGKYDGECFVNVFNHHLIDERFITHWCYISFP